MKEWKPESMECIVNVTVWGKCVFLLKPTRLIRIKNVSFWNCNSWLLICVWIGLWCVFCLVLPTVTLKPTKVTMRKGLNLTLVCNTSGMPTPNLNWSTCKLNSAYEVILTFISNLQSWFSCKCEWLLQFPLMWMPQRTDYGSLFLPLDKIQQQITKKRKLWLFSSNLRSR